MANFLRLGFERAGRGRGPHERYVHAGLGLTAHIPGHRGTIPQGTALRMVRRFGVTDDEFLTALNGESRSVSDRAPCLCY